jgi:hypothetical protein
MALRYIIISDHQTGTGLHLENPLRAAAALDEYLPRGNRAAP